MTCVSDDAAYDDTRPISCDRCQPIACKFIHDINASDCPLGGCDMCIDLYKLDAEILSTQIQLKKLVQARRVMKTRIKSRHDIFNSRLPAEVVSYIFELVLKEWPNLKRINEPPVLSLVVIGVVCKRWRDITLSTPALWSSITTKTKHWTSPLMLDLVEKWLCRSGVVSLSLTLASGPYPYISDSMESSDSLHRGPHSAIAPMINLLRFHADRWKIIRYYGSWRLFRDLFNKIDTVVPIGIALHTTFVSVDENITRYPVSPPYSIHPNIFKSDGFPLAQMDIRWNNLTRLDATSMHLDEVLHILSEANCLIQCVIIQVMSNSFKYPLPTVPIVHHRLCEFTIDSYMYESDTEIVLHHLTCPSLKNLDYSWKLVENDSPQNLFTFLDYCAESLEVFSFRGPFLPIPTSWFWRMSSLQHLRISYPINSRPFSSPPPEQSLDIDALLQALATTSILPQLHTLDLEVLWFPETAWPLLCDMLWRPWKKLHINYLGQRCSPMADESILKRLHRASSSSVLVINVQDRGRPFGHTDMLDNCPRLIALKELPFRTVSSFDKPPNLPVWNKREMFF